MCSFADAIFGTDPVFDGQELRRFTDNLHKITAVFDYVNTNEATARNYINPFMVEAVAKIKSGFPLTRLAVEEDFDGTRGYGRLDYVVYCKELAVMITEAKMTELRNGLVRNIVQLRTGAEVYTKICCRSYSGLSTDTSPFPY